MYRLLYLILVFGLMLSCTENSDTPDGDKGTESADDDSATGSDSIGDGTADTFTGAGTDDTDSNAGEPGGDTDTAEDLLHSHVDRYRDTATYTEQPDTPTTPVESCEGQPDMVLCNVVTEPDRSYDVCVNGVCVSPGCGDTTCNTYGPHFRLPAMSYDRSSTFLRKGAAEPVVVDLVTGLHWQGCLAGLSENDCTAGEMLQVSHDTAFEYCDGLKWNGFDDWYLPDIWEMYTLLDFKYEKHYDEALFPNTTSDFAWTSGLSTTGRYWGFSWSRIYFFSDLDEDRPLRCVRRGFSGDAKVTNDERFENIQALNSFDNMIDHSTGLRWLDVDPIHEYPVADAAATCDDLEFENHSDWRLPSFLEAVSLEELNRIPKSQFFEYYMPVKEGIFSNHDATLTPFSTEEELSIFCVRIYE